MKHKPRIRWLVKRGRYSRGILVALAIGAALGLMSHFNLLYGAQLKSSDLLFGSAYLQSPRQQDEIVIVAIDDRSLGQLGHYSSWSRSYHADMADALNSAGARVIAFDVLFSEPTPDDEALAASIRSAGNVVIPVAYASITNKLTATGTIVSFQDILNPIRTLQESAVAIGHANIFPDEDGVVRRLPITISGGTDPTPALSLTVVATYLRRPRVIESTIEDDVLTFAGRSIPLDSSRNMLINYTCDSLAPIGFKTVPYADVLTDNFEPNIFQDKIVMIGATAVGLGDTFWTPAGQRMSGVEIHATAVDTILTANFLRPVPTTTTVASIMVLALLCGLMVLRSRTVWSTVGCVLTGIGYYLFAFALFDKGVIVNTLYPPLTILGTFVGVNLHNIVVERREKTEMAKTFGRYISAPVVDNVLTALREGELKLGGEEREVTVLFADVRGFTSITERTPVVELVKTLNRYLSVIIEATLKHDGMVNKLGGDSIMAVWNAPIELEAHAMLAVRTAVRAVRDIMELQEHEPELPKMDFGIGINTGKVVAGNMGSANRLEYSVVGDAVNTAARLSDIAPGGEIWIGSTSYTLVKGNIIAETLPPLAVRGKREPVHAYRVVDCYDLRDDNQNSQIPVAAG
jgi:adenylate cyclase